MAIGGNFQEALLKGLAALELDGKQGDRERRLSDPVRLRRHLSVPNWERLFAVLAALRQGWTVEEVAAITHIDPWFLRQIQEVLELEAELACWDLRSVPAELLRRGKEAGLSDARLAELLGGREAAVRERRIAAGVRRVYKRVDTCAAEFPATTPYLYSTFGEEDEVDPSDRPKVVILGSGPNRIGQGIEFDYCCVHAAFALGKLGYETVMVNCNPETVSTDYDTSDRLYFEPLTLEHVLSVVEREQPVGVVVQLGGQTPLKLVRGLVAAGAPLWGTSADAIDLAEDRERFGALLAEEGILQPENGNARTPAEALATARRIGLPVMVRPSYVLGGRAMVICHDEASVEGTLRRALEVSPEHPVLLDRFLEDATELDLDLLADGTDSVVCGILQHIEEAGIHSGDSAAVLPPWRVDAATLDEMERIAHRLAKRLGVVGLMNIQFALHHGKVYVLEVNPRASRTVPFIAKAVGLPLAGMAAQVMAGKTLAEVGLTATPAVPRFFVKVPVFPFHRFPGVDPMLGPEMKSTGEVMGIGETFGEAFAKGWIAAGNRLPLEGTAFLSVHDRDKRALVPVALRLRQLGFRLVATGGTAEHLRGQGVPVDTVNKLHEGRPHVVDHLINGDIHLVVNTPLGPDAHREDAEIRRVAVAHRVPCITTLSGALAAAEGIAALRRGTLSLVPLHGLGAAVVAPVPAASG
jgi:carbamoyl-phosphate synthase large subunit